MAHQQTEQRFDEAVPIGIGPNPCGGLAVTAAQQPVVVVCRYTRWVAATAGLLFLPLTLGPLATAHTTAAIVGDVVVALMNVAMLVRAFPAGTVRAADGNVVIRSALWTHRYAAADIDHFEAQPGLVGARKRLILVAVTSSGPRSFPDFACARSGRGSDLVPTTASRLNAYLAAYR
jgi:hypothetical protein